MRGNVDVPALRAERAKVGDGRLRPRQDDEIADGEGMSLLYHDDVDVGFRRQRIEVVEIGDMRQEGHCHSDFAVAAHGSPLDKIVGVFRR